MLRNCHLSKSLQIINSEERVVGVSYRIHLIYRIYLKHQGGGGWYTWARVHSSVGINTGHIPLLLSALCFEMGVSHWTQSLLSQLDCLANKPWRSPAFVPHLQQVPPHLALDAGHPNSGAYASHGKHKPNELFPQPCVEIFFKNLYCLVLEHKLCRWHTAMSQYQKVREAWLVKTGRNTEGWVECPFGKPGTKAAGLHITVGCHWWRTWQWHSWSLFWSSNLH